MEELIKQLAKTELFSGLPEEVLRQEVMPHRLVQEYRKGVFLIEPQQKVNRFGIVLSGKIHIMHIFSQGNYSLMTVLTAGDIVGADLICTRTQRSPYHAMAAADTQVIYFPAELLTEHRMVSGIWHMEMQKRLTTWISNENMKKEYRLAILSQKGLRERILTFLTMQASRRQKTAFTISFSREELAAFLCVNRSALSHELSQMQAEGMITFRKNYFCLHFLKTCDSGQLMLF